jgi:NadR type nicotinamide-nucleotide adenylyltransferase
MRQLKKIVILGPESTGKSTLCSGLAEHYDTGWVAEFARAYLLANGKQYMLPDLLRIAKGQLQTEDEGALKMAQQGKPFLFIDTDLYVIKIWSEFVFNSCDNTILTGISNRHYDLYLLCNIDLPWVPDELREYPDLRSRQKLFHYYKDAMVNQEVPWVEINGSDEERLAAAITAIDATFNEVT